MASKIVSLLYTCDQNCVNLATIAGQASSLCYVGIALNFTVIGSGGAYNIVTVLQHRSIECTALMKSSIEHFSCHTVREIESEDSVLLGIRDQHPMCTEYLIMLLQCMQGY